MYIDLSKMNSGFCDRLRQITFCIAYNKILKKKIRKIEIFEIKNKECPYYFTELLKIKNFIVTNVKRKKLKTLQMTPFNSSVSIDTCLKFNKNKNINNFRLLHEWKKTYKLLIPKKKILKKINKFKKYGKYVCVHSRITDKLVNNYTYFFEIPKKDLILKSQLNEFIENIYELIPKKYKNIYLATDEMHYRSKLTSILKKEYNLINNRIKFNSSKLRQTSGDDFILDLFIMSESDYLISTTGGNVPDTALMMSQKNKKYIKWTSTKQKYRIFFLIRTILFNLRRSFKSLLF